MLEWYLLKAHLVVLVKQHYLLERILSYSLLTMICHLSMPICSAQSYIFQKSNAKYNKKSYEECDNDETLIALCESSGAEKVAIFFRK